MPLFVRGPGVPTGSRIEKLVLNTDFAPTFADLGSMSFGADGRSLAPLLRGKEPFWRAAIPLERLGKEESSEEQESGEGEGEAQAFQAVGTETHTYVEYDNGRGNSATSRTTPTN